MLLTRSFYNPALLRSDLRRTWPLLGAYTLLWVLILPLHLLRELTESAPEFAADMTRFVLEDAHAATTWINVFAGLIFAASLFSYLTSTRATYGLHSLPVSRGCQFRTHVLCGVGGVLCGNALTTVLALLAQLGTGVEWGRTLSWLVCSTVSFLLFFAIGVLCCMLCGWLPAVIVAYGAANGGVVLVQLLVNMLRQIFYPSFNDSLLNFGADHPVIWLTPVLRLQACMNNVALYAREAEVDTSERWLTLLVYGIAAVVLLLGSSVLYRLRRSERSGDTLSFRPLQPVVRWAAGLFGGLGLGIVFAAIVSTMDDFALLLGCSLLMGFVCMTGAQMLIAKTPRVFKKLWPELLALWLVIAAICGCMDNDVFGYERKIPKPEQVESVAVNPNRWHGSCATSDPDEIDTVLQAHAYLQKNSGSAASDNTGTCIVLTYALKDGSTLSRVYYIEDSDRLGILPLLETDTFRRSVVMNSSDLAKPEGRPAGTAPALKAQDLRTGYWDYNGQQQELTQEQAQALYTAILADAAAMDMTTVDLNEADYCLLNIHLQNLEGDLYADLHLNSQCTRTLQLLQDWGIIESPGEIFGAKTYEEATYEATLLD